MKTKKFLKQALTLLLTLLMLLSTTSLGLSAAQVDVAETGATEINSGDIIWYSNPGNWSAVTVHVWGGTSSGSTWPGKTMTKDDSTGYFYWVSDGNYVNCIFSNNGSNQTGDLTIEGPGYLYNGSSWSSFTNDLNNIPATPVSDSDLLAVLKGEKIMFYIGEPSSWGQSTFYLRNGAGGSTVDSGNYVITYSSNRYAVVAASANTGYYVSHSTSWNGEAINGTPSSGVAYLCNNNDSTSGCATSGSAYSVSASLASNSITAGEKATISSSSKSNGNVGTTTQMMYFVTSDGNVFYELSYSDTALDTSKLNAGTYTIYPAIYDGYVYARGNAITLTVAEEVTEFEYTVTAGEGGSAAPESGKVSDGGSVEITATPAEGYEFDKWEVTGGEVDSETSATTTFTPTADGATAHATFSKIPCTVTVNNVTGGTVSGGGSYYYNDEVTLKATPYYANSYAFTGWNITGNYSIVSGSLTTEEIKIKITGAVTATPSYRQTITHSVSASANISDAGEVTPTSQRVADGSSITLSATAKAGYRFTGWNITSGSYTVVTGTTADAEFTIKPTSDVTAVANFVETYTVVFKDWDGDTLDTQTVDKGDSATAPANPTRDHYTFKEWDTDFSNVTSDLTVTAVYKGNTYTVNVSAGTGGTASTNESSVTYPNSVTLTADPDDGYALVNWTITGDYDVVSGTDKSETFVIIPKQKNLTVTATFAQGRKLTVYTYSADGFNKLTLTENGTNNVLNEVEQPGTEVFNEVTWNKSDEKDISLDATSLTAQLSGEGGIPAGSGNLVVFNNTLGWSNVHLYTRNSDMWNGNNGATTNSSTHYSMTKIEGTNYWYAYISTSYNYVLFIKDQQNNYNNIWNTSAAYRSDYSTSSPMFTPNTTSNQSTNGTTYYSDGSWGAAPTVSAESDVITLTDKLFKDGAWAGKTEVWIYQNGTTEEVTLRRGLLTLVETTTAEYNGGTNSKDYTASSWTAFVEAYENAKSVSGAGASTQAQIDDAYTALDTAYKALELQAYYTVNVTQNFAGSATVGTNSFKDLSKEVQVVQGSNVSIKFVAPTYYYIVSVKINGQVVASNPVLETDDNPWTFVGDYTFTSDNNTIEVEYCHNPFLTYKESGTTGGTVDFTGTQVKHHSDGTISVSYGHNATISITAPDLYYINTVTIGSYTYTNTDESKTTYSPTITGITADTEVIITYIKRATHTITIHAYGAAGGTLYYGDVALNTAGDTIEVLSGTDVTITAVPNNGYGIDYWNIDGVSAGTRQLTYTFTNVSVDGHTVGINWKELQAITVTVAGMPHSVGTATATSGSQSASSKGTSTITITEGDTVTLTATVTDKCYEFVSWTIEGSYYENSGTRNNATFVITANSTLKVTANFVQTKRAIYLVDQAKWGTCCAYWWKTGSDGPVAWPGTEMEYAYTASDNTTKVYVAYVPLEYENIAFNNNNNGKQTGDLKITENYNTFNNSTNAWSNYIEKGYYVIGNWNGSEHTPNSNNKFVQNSDGTYTVTITVSSTTDGYIYVNPADENTCVWESTSSTQTGNSENLTYNNKYLDFPDRKTVKIEIDKANYGKAYDVTFTFNPATGDFSWTKVENVPTIVVNGTDGMLKNQADTLMSSSNGRVGDTYFDLDTVNRVVTNVFYDQAFVVAGSPVTFYTQVNKTGTSYDYYVAGWVVNGTEFVSATSLGNGRYSGSYAFTKDSNIVPVYFHTNDWLKANAVETVTVYAVTDKDIVNWNEYFAAYTWYKDSNTNVYDQFGLYPGQLMIPITGLDGVYYTIVETTAFDGTPISGILFDNYPSAEGVDNSAVNKYTNIQTYDYYEFMSLLKDGKENITFVVKDTNTNNNKEDINGSTGSQTLSNYQFVQYTDYSGLKTDIFGNNIESIDSTLSDSDALYIIQTGPIVYNTTTSDVLSGDYYVDCYLYNATGAYLGKCASYQLHNEESTIWELLADYKNKRAYISYETVNGSRYDGEWYGDAKNVTVTVNLAVKIAIMGDDGKYTIDADGEVNLANYGKAYINSLQNVDVTRGTKVSLAAMPLTGYKFVGWYTADGTLFDKNLNSTAMAAIGTYYVAVFEPLAEGLFYVNHYIYTGLDVNYYIPLVHGGNAQLYVGIQNVTQGTTTTLLQGNSAGLAATEGDKLLITIATDAFGADKFYAWYTDAVDKNGLANFEEVGVDSLDNLAFSDPTSQYYMNGISTVVGSIDRVYFQFEYIVGGDEDEFVLNFYSDLQPVSDKVTLVYQYTDRYGNAKQYVVPYTLTDNEIKGFAGNNYEEFTPAYISSTDGSWVNTILANAPYVEDYFKDTTWKINSAMYDTMTFLLWATQPETMYTVTTTVVTEDGADVLVNSVPYNTVLDLDIRDLVPDASYTGFWYQDVNSNGTYEKTVDIMLTYGPYYGYRVTQDMAVNYQYVDSADDYKFNVSLDAPVYGREQTTDSSGNNKTDIVIIDYVINILTPYFYISHPEFTPIYDGKEITDADWNKTLVTIESLKAAGYNVEYGVILEQVGTFDIRKDYAGDFAEAEKAAALKGYGTATDEELLKNFINSDSAKGWINGQNSTYGYKYDASGLEITNKNRVLFVLEHNNTEKNQNRFYNVYSYLTVTTPDNVTTTYISNVQTLNIYEEGIKDAVVENNTSFA